MTDNETTASEGNSRAKKEPAAKEIASALCSQAIAGMRTRAFLICALIAAAFIPVILLSDRPAWQRYTLLLTEVLSLLTLALKKGRAD